MTNVLIPTDFTSASIKLAEQALQVIEVNTVNIVFFHAFDLPSSAFDLLGHRKKPYAGVFTDSFRQQCKQLKEDNNEKIEKVCFKFLEGTGIGHFRNFIDANEIDLIYCPEHYQFVPVNNMSANPLPLFKKSGVKVIRELAKRQGTITEVQLVSPTAVLVTAGS